MERIIREKCTLLVENRKAITKAFKWESGLMSLAASSLYAAMGKAADPEKLKECEKMLKSETSVLSEFRGNVKMPLLCKMALSENPQEYLGRVRYIYSLLQKSKILGDEYRVLAAMTLCDHLGDKAPESYVEKTNEIYSAMKENHKWITSNEDIPFAAMLAVTGQDIGTISENSENAYSVLKKYFRDSNAVQALSHVLSLEDLDVEENCAKTVAIYDYLKEQKHKFGKSYELATLGSLAMLDIPSEKLGDFIIYADEYLKDEKGFGDWSLGATERRMYAALMVLSACSP